MLSPRTFAASFAAWETLYWVAHFAMSAPRVQKRFTPVVCRDAPAYIVSTVHAVFAAARGVRHIVRLWPAPNVIKLCIPTKVTAEAAPFLAESFGVILTNISLAGYLTSDLIHVAWHYPHLGKKDTIAHHFAFLSCALIAGHYQMFPFAFAWLIVGEASTPLLNLRWYLIRQGHGASKMLVHVSTVFAAVFFATRFCVYGAGLLHLYLTYSQMPDEVRGVLSGAVAAFLVFGFALNLVWLRHIVVLASATPRPSGKKIPDAAFADDVPAAKSEGLAVSKAGKAE